MDVIGVHFKVENIIGLVPFQWHSQKEIGNIAILVLWRVCENPYWAVETSLKMKGMFTFF